MPGVLDQAVRIQELRAHDRGGAAVRAVRATRASSQPASTNWMSWLSEERVLALGERQPQADVHGAREAGVLLLEHDALAELRADGPELGDEVPRGARRRRRRRPPPPGAVRQGDEAPQQQLGVDILVEVRGDHGEDGHVPVVGRPLADLSGLSRAGRSRSRRRRDASWTRRVTGRRSCPRSSGRGRRAGRTRRRRCARPRRSGRRAAAWRRAAGIALPERCAQA